MTVFSQRLGTDDKAKTGAHLASIRDLELLLQQAATTPAVACTQPVLPSKTAGIDTPTLMKMMFDLGALAIKCDMTRFMTFELR